MGGLVNIDQNVTQRAALIKTLEEIKQQHKQALERNEVRLTTL